MSGDVSYQNGVIAFNWGSLLLKPEVGIDMVNDPGAVVGDIFSCQGSFLLAGNRRIYCRAQRRTREDKLLSVEIWVQNDLNLLSIADYIVTSELIYFVYFLDDEN